MTGGVVAALLNHRLFSVNSPGSEEWLQARSAHRDKSNVAIIRSDGPGDPSYGNRSGHNVAHPTTAFHGAMPDIPDLPGALRRLVEQIPPQRVATYGQLAQALGSSYASKWVASWLLEEPPTETCPTHRVVRADGSLGDYRTRSAADHAATLEAEGIAVVCGKVDLTRHGAPEFQSEAPLKTLADWQVIVSEQVELTLPTAVHRQFLSEGLVGGVDVSYTASNRAVAAYALVDLNTGELVWSATHEDEVRFPYISGFLALREIPIILPR